MPSGRRSRELRHTVALPVPRAPRERRASGRVLAVVGAVAALAAVAAVLAVVLTGHGSTSAPAAPAVGSLRGAVAGARDVDRLFKGIPQHGNVLGSPTAPVTMVEYVDVQCPYCRMLETDVLPGIVRRYVRTGKLRIVLRTWAFIGPDSVRGQAAVLAAGRQNRSFNMLELLYDQQGVENTGWLSEDLLVAVAASVPGLHVRTLLAERSLPAVRAAADGVARLAASGGITATPTLLVGRSGSAPEKVELTGPSDSASVVRAIEAALS